MSADARDAWPRHGTHRVPGPARPVAAELARRGWRAVVVQASVSDDELWDHLTEALGLPGWFGRNLDALEEALADLAGPTALVLAAWSAYARARPDRWARLLDVLQGWAGAPGAAHLVLLTD